MLSDRMKNLNPYVPGEQPQDRAYIKLNTNENPYPPTSKIHDFLKDFDIERLRLYSDPLSARLREKLGQKFGVHKDQVFVSNGSDEALSFCFYAFFDNKNGPLLFPEFTYSFYPVYCDFYGISYEKVPLNHDFSVDINDFLSRETSCGVIFANPNAPTGVCLPIDKILYLLQHYPSDRVVIVDEAYIDFGGDSAIPFIQQHPNLLIVRTFSKGMSLAGLRLGFVIGHEKLIDALFTVKDSFNSYPADMLSQFIGEIAISDDAHYQETVRKIIHTRKYFSTTLKEMGWHVLPSKANFVFVEKEGVQGKDIYQKLKNNGILVRHFDIEGIKNFVRITIGKEEDMNTLIEQLRKLFS